MNKEKIKELVIKYVFDGKNTTEKNSDEDVYLGLRYLLDSEMFDGISLGCIREGYDEPGIRITCYSEKIGLMNGGCDIMIERVSNTSIYGLTEHIENAINKSKQI